MANSKYEYVKTFEQDDRLPQSNWIAVRIDGCHFHRFSTIHEFQKPNDSSALDLMNTCARLMLEHFPDIVFAYGESVLCWMRKANFIKDGPAYVMNWKKIFPDKDLKELPCFDARAVCYPRMIFIRDYLSWRQADCHVNNQYNTCFWMLVKSGKTRTAAQSCLEGTETKEKNKILFQQFGINYDKLPDMFRKGSCVYRNEVEEVVKMDKNGNPVKRWKKIVTVDHVDIIGPKFWDEHPYILQED